MSTMPQTRYAKHGSVHIAYQSLGQGPPDLILVPEWVTHVEAAWDHELTAGSLRRLSSYARVTLFDKRGVGLSDPVAATEIPSLEAWMDDLSSVLDAIGTERAVLLGHGHGGQMAMLFAATYPERVESLILLNAYACLSRQEDYPWGFPQSAQDKAIAVTEQFWGLPESPVVDLLAPSVASDRTVREWWARLERLACSPGTAVAMQAAIFQMDIRHVLSSISVPTLVVHNAGDQFIRVGHGRYLAERIDGAQWLALPGTDHWGMVGNNRDAVLAAVAEFITGTSGMVHADRVLATVLFTDVVDSTTQLAGLGDRRWRELLEDLDALTARQLDRFGGRLVSSTGDGYLATFDGPGRAIRCGVALRDGARGLGLQLRTGLHCGEIERRGTDVAGIAVHIAARVMALAQPGELLLSSSVPPLVAGSELTFSDRGEHELRGVPGTWRLFALAG